MLFWAVRIQLIGDLSSFAYFCYFIKRDRLIVSLCSFVYVSACFFSGIPLVRFPLVSFI
jgi:hypothetical protein